MGEARPGRAIALSLPPTRRASLARARPCVLPSAARGRAPCWNPGLLGSARAFAAFTKQLGARPGGFAPLRAPTRPYILRRLKTDRRIIADLPEKTELRAYCGLSRVQAALYQESVRSLAEELRRID